MSDANRYTELIAGAHFDKPKYQQFIYELTEPLNEARKRLAVFYKHFDVDTAVGVQLDAVGVRVGISRRLPMKLVGVYFALDDVDGVGFDKGVWKGQFDPSDGMVTLDDETYRAVIKTKILANKFDGKNESVPEFLNTALGYFGVPAKLFDFQDQQNMHVVINLTKAETPPIVWELISRRLIDIVAAGVGMQIADNDIPFEIAEAALAHLVGSQVVRAYQRGDYFAPRQKIMLSWHAYIQSCAQCAQVLSQKPDSTGSSD